MFLTNETALVLVFVVVATLAVIALATMVRRPRAERFRDADPRLAPGDPLNQATPEQLAAVVAELLLEQLLGMLEERLLAKQNGKPPAGQGPATQRNEIMK